MVHETPKRKQNKSKNNTWPVRSEQTLNKKLRKNKQTNENERKLKQNMCKQLLSNFKVRVATWNRPWFLRKNPATKTKQNEKNNVNTKKTKNIKEKQNEKRLKEPRCNLKGGIERVRRVTLISSHGPEMTVHSIQPNDWQSLKLSPTRATEHRKQITVQLGKRKHPKPREPITSNLGKTNEYRQRHSQTSRSEATKLFETARQCQSYPQERLAKKN